MWRTPIVCECICGFLAFLQAGDASGTGLLDVAARVWDPKLAALVDPQLQEWLPSLIGPDEVCTLTAWAAFQGRDARLRARCKVIAVHVSASRLSALVCQQDPLPLALIKAERTG